MEGLDPDIRRVELPDLDGKSRYGIGPSTSLNLGYQEWSLLNIDRGPCKYQYVVASSRSDALQSLIQKMLSKLAR